MSSTLASPSTLSTAEPKFATYYDAAPLHVLAEYMRDGEWLDVMTGQGLLARVRIVQVIVRRRDERIVFKQQWLEETERDVWPRTQRIVIDGNDIWQVRPTLFTPDEVTPWGAREEVGTTVAELDHVQRALVAEAVIEATIELFKVGREHLVSANTDRRDVHHRHQAIIVIYEMTDYRPADLCREVFSYKSQGGWNTARWKSEPPTNYGSSEYYQRRLAQQQGFVKGVRDIGRAADKRLAPNRYRRPRDAFAHEYTPVLS